jgi:transcriptional regulator with XRE-family HTH domain
MTTGTLMTFADKLKELRLDRGWTQEQLANRSGVPLWTVRGLEQGKRTPSWDSVVRLARAFGETSGVFDDCDEVVAPRRPRKPPSR